MVEDRPCTGRIWVRRVQRVVRALSSVGEANLPSICPLRRAPSVLAWAELTSLLPAKACSIRAGLGRACLTPARRGALCPCWPGPNLPHSCPLDWPFPTHTIPPRPCVILHHTVRNHTFTNKSKGSTLAPTRVPDLIHPPPYWYDPELPTTSKL